MTKGLTTWAVALAMLALSMPDDADAKRFGGGASSGMQRNVPARSAPEAPPAKPANLAAAPKDVAQPAPAAPAAAGAAAAATAAGKRSWLGPVAGLAAGLGLVALMSHLGLGEAMAEFIMMALLVLAVIFVVRLLLRRFALNRPSSPQPALAGAGLSGRTAAQPSVPDVTVLRREAFAAVAAPAHAPATSVPAGFDRGAFERAAKAIFIRMQAAHDGADLDDLRRFTTPEMFAAVKLDLQDRGGKSQTTDVVRVDAEVLDVAEEDARQIVSVHFQGLIREDREAPAQAFDEVWHLVKPVDDSRPWAIAGIQQRA